MYCIYGYRGNYYCKPGSQLMAKRGRLRRQKLAMYYEELEARGNNLEYWQVATNKAIKAANATFLTNIDNPNGTRTLRLTPEARKRAEEFWGSPVTTIQDFLINTEEPNE